MEIGTHKSNLEYCLTQNSLTDRFMKLMHHLSLVNIYGGGGHQANGLVRSSQVTLFTVVFLLNELPAAEGFFLITLVIAKTMQITSPTIVKSLAFHSISISTIPTFSKEKQEISLQRRSINNILYQQKFHSCRNFRQK